MTEILDFVKSFLSDLIAGLVGAAILAGLAIVFRYVGPERWRRWVDKLRRIGWPILTFVFFTIALISAILTGDKLISIVVLCVILALVAASVLLFRYSSIGLRNRLNRLRSYSWPLLTALFLLTTILALYFKPPNDIYNERIVFVVDLADNEMMVMRDVLDELEPQLQAKVFLMSVDSSRYVSRLDKMVSNKEMKWDLLAADNNMVGILAAKNLVEELTKFTERETLVPNTLLLSLRPILVFEDKFYFAPFRPNVKIALYNKKKFDQYGLSPPRTWHELLEVARFFKEKEGVGRVAIQGSPGKTSAVTVFEFVKAGGGDPLKLADEGSRRTFEFLQELEPYLAPEYPETSFDTANELLIDEQVYLVMNWTFAIGVVVEEAGKTEIQAYSGWRGPQGEFHVLGGDVLAIPKGAPHPEEAVRLLELLLSKEVQKELFDRLRWLPIRSDAYADISPELSSYFDAVLDAVSHAATRPADPKWGMIENVLDQAFTGMVRERAALDSLTEYCSCLEKIPSAFLRYQVNPGDTLETIAHSCNTSVEVIAQANGITPGTSIGPGQTILVPMD